MTYEDYRIIFVFFAILSALLLLVAIGLFIYLKIPAIIGDLTGLTAKRAIAKSKKQNAQEVTQETLRRNLNLGKFTGNIFKSGYLKKIHSNSRLLSSSRDLTAKLTKEDENVTVPLNQKPVFNETTVLGCEVSVVVEKEIIYVHTEVVID